MIKAIEEKIVHCDESVVIISTGNGLKDVKNGQRAAGDAITMKPDLETFIKAYEELEGRPCQ